jgi:hypothetical protein
MRMRKAQGFTGSKGCRAIEAEEVFDVKPLITNI